MGAFTGSSANSRVHSTTKLHFNTVPNMSLDEQFKQTADDVSNKMNKKLTNDELKEIYALYKQGSVGDINTERPGMLDFKGKAKWDSWNSKKGMSQEDAKQKYIDFGKQMMEKYETI